MKKHTRGLMKNESGQALVFVIATMVVALSIGVGASLRNLATISRTSQTDTSARAQAAAEGGAENVLSHTQDELEEFANGTVTLDPINFAPSNTTDKITAVAVVTVEHYNLAAIEESYLPLEIDEDQLMEVKLNGNTIEVCWSSLDSAAGSDLYYIAYNDSGVITRGGVSAAGLPFGFPLSYETEGFASAASGRDSFAQCHTPTLPASAKGIRIRTINAASRLGVYELTDTLPNQGYLITSVGKLLDAAEGVEAEAVVKVIRSAPFLPGVFDFAIFSGSDSGVLD